MQRKIKDGLNYKYSSDENLWELSEWISLEKKTISKIASTKNEKKSYKICKTLGKKILKNYSNSFFTVTRFLPKAKRDLVEIIYASVRFPDEIVDTLVLETGTLGIRISDSNRFIVPRTNHDVSLSLRGHTFQVNYK